MPLQVVLSVSVKRPCAAVLRSQSSPKNKNSLEIASRLFSDFSDFNGFS